MKNIHFIGIGGIGMSALARLYHADGRTVSGSDQSRSDLTDELLSEGMNVSIRHADSNLPEDIELVVYSEAIPSDNPEFREAQARNIKTVSYFEALGEFSRDFYTIAVCGTHGKTTTTAMLALSMIACDMDPTVVVGTKLKEFNGKNMRIGSRQDENPYFVVEACEYRRSFLHLHPNMIVLTNLDPEHLDYYKDFEDYKSAFREFIGKMPRDGILIFNEEDEDVREIAKDFSVQKHGFKNDTSIILNLQIPGDHNRMNAMAALRALFALQKRDSSASCSALEGGAGIEFLSAEKRSKIIPAPPLEIRRKALHTLNSYQGSWRRFEYKGSFYGAKIYDDYAHHPTEIRATLKATREKFPHQRIIAVFQPHQYSRTKKLLHDFTLSFSDADSVIIPNIYRVRDSNKDIQSIDAKALVSALSKHHSNVHFTEDFPKTVRFLKKTLQNDDVLLIMGAGNVNTVSDMLLNENRDDDIII